MWNDPESEELQVRKLEAISDFGMFLSQIEEGYEVSTVMVQVVLAGYEIVKTLVEAPETEEGMPE